MKRVKLVVVILILTTVSPVHAALPVIDAGAITQMLIQILTLKQQLSTAENQLTTANDQLATASDQCKTAEDQLRAYTVELARQQSVKAQAIGSLGSLRTLPKMGL